MSKMSRVVMPVLVFLILFLNHGVAAASYNPTDPIHNDDMISYINSVQSQWIAHRSPRFDGMTLAEAAAMCGTLPLSHIPEKSKTKAGSSSSLSHSHNDDSSYASQPVSFDARAQWPGCIGGIENQGECGACWAFATTEALADRMCIVTGVKDIVLSPQYLISCESDQLGCSGGTLDNAWRFLASYGTVSEACFEYENVETSKAPSCPDSICPSDSDVTVPARFFGKMGSGLGDVPSVDSIMREIVANGPVSTGFTAYADLYSYKSGVYSHISGDELGGHAVKIIGWGVDNGVPYWLMANSWGAEWGMDGYFYMLRGVDECGVESGAYVGQFGFMNGTVIPSKDVSWPSPTEANSSPVQSHVTKDIDEANSLSRYILFCFALLLGIAFVTCGSKLFILFLAIASTAAGAGVTWLLLVQYTKLSITIVACISVAAGLALTLICGRIVRLGFFISGFAVAFVLCSMVFTIAPLQSAAHAESARLLWMVVVGILAFLLALVGALIPVQSLIPYTCMVGSYLFCSGLEFVLSALLPKAKASLTFFAYSEYSLVSTFDSRVDKTSQVVEPLEGLSRMAVWLFVVLFGLALQLTLTHTDYPSFVVYGAEETKRLRARRKGMKSIRAINAESGVINVVPRSSRPSIQKPESRPLLAMDGDDPESGGSPQTATTTLNYYAQGGAFTPAELAALERALAAESN